MPTTARNILEAKIHESFTVAADQLFGRGVIDRDVRIGLSGLIGSLLDDFGSAVGVLLENSIVDDSAAEQIMLKERGGAAVFKGENGLWNWMGIVSNNILDDGWPVQNIISEKAHQFMVSAVDSGFYKDMFGKEAPDLWPWHLPMPIGKTMMVAYDERGFLVAAGVQMPGELNTKMFESFNRAGESGEKIGMSHMVPPGLYGVDPVDRRIINWYLSEEFTVAPLEYSANQRTAWITKHNSSAVWERLNANR